MRVEEENYVVRRKVEREGLVTERPTIALLDELWYKSNGLASSEKNNNKEMV